MSQALDDILNYTQYPIIRHGLIRNAGEIWGNFKKWLVGQSNLRNAHTLLDVPLLATTVMGHKDAQKIALGTKLFCL